MNAQTKDGSRDKFMLNLSRVLVYIFLFIIVVTCLFSFVLLFINATRSNAELQGGFTLKPSSHLFENMKNAWNDKSINIPRGMFNSFIIAAISAGLTTYFSALTAYGIHGYTFKFKKLIFACILAVMVIPKQVAAVGFVQLVYQYKLTNNYLPLVIPGIAAPIVFFYMKQYMDAMLPLEVIEAARMDGSTEFGIFNRIVLPMITPALAVQAIFAFVESWNNYFMPSLILTKADYKTVPIMIAQLRSADYSKFDMGKVYMFILLAILPVILVYIALSKHIIKGVTAGSVKG